MIPLKHGLAYALLLAFSLAAAARGADDTNPTSRPVDAKLPTLFVAGDSTARNHGAGMVGWGDPMGDLFDRTRINVVNSAMAGRSTRTYTNEGRWDKIITAAKAGDFVIVQFGHNDIGDPVTGRAELPGTGEETRDITDKNGKPETVHTFGWYIRKFAAEAKAKGMTLILSSPTPHSPRRPATGSTDAPPAEYKVDFGNFRQWDAALAKELGIAYVDTTTIITSHYNGMSPGDIKEKYFTAKDDTHTSAAGAALNAQSMAEGIRALPDCPLAGYLLPAK